MRAIVVVGLGFGDEGKGATVDWLCSYSDNVDTVVRYSGGHQCAHTVEREDGKKHTFAQFGSGTLRGVPTQLAKHVMICPPWMDNEARALKHLGITDPYSTLRVDPECPVVTCYHIAANRIRETRRGVDWHGSCGAGIGELASFLQNAEPLVVRAKDLRADRGVLLEKLAATKAYYGADTQLWEGPKTQWNEMLREDPKEEGITLRECSANLQISPFEPAGNMVFEGAQGVLLDESFGFHPYTTWNTVTTKQAEDLLEGTGCTVHKLGVIRAYHTRHGPGPFPTEELHSAHDPNNPKNHWQGALRTGALDLTLLKYALDVCPVDGLALTCIDQIPEKDIPLCIEYQNVAGLQKPGSIGDQESLRRLLEIARPSVTKVTLRHLLDVVSEHCEISVVSRGPQAKHRSPR